MGLLEHIYQVTGPGEIWLGFSVNNFQENIVTGG